jgi:hypothetical protein
MNTTLAVAALSVSRPTGQNYTVLAQQNRCPVVRQQQYVLAYRMELHEHLPRVLQRLVRVPHGCLGSLRSSILLLLRPRLDCKTL